MNSPLLVVIIVIAVVVGSTLSIMNKACKSGYRACNLFQKRAMVSIGFRSRD
jgi:uncharacterized membrane protein